MDKLAFLDTLLDIIRTEKVTAEQLMEGAFRILINMKSIQMLERNSPEIAGHYINVKERYMAQLKGIYNLLCEG